MTKIPTIIKSASNVFFYILGALGLFVIPIGLLFSDSLFTITYEPIKVTQGKIIGKKSVPSTSRYNPSLKRNETVNAQHLVVYDSSVDSQSVNDLTLYLKVPVGATVTATTQRVFKSSRYWNAKPKYQRTNLISLQYKDQLFDFEEVK